MKYVYVVKLGDDVIGIVDEKFKDVFDEKINVRDILLEEIPYYETESEVLGFDCDLWESFERAG